MFASLSSRQKFGRYHLNLILQIVSAAHCVISIPERYVQVFVGAWRLDELEGYSVKKFFPHEKYNRPFMHNDIALIKLAEPLTFSISIQKISLSAEYVRDKEFPLVLAGWGKITVMFFRINYTSRHKSKF